MPGSDPQGGKKPAVAAADAAASPGGRPSEEAAPGQAEAASSRSVPSLKLSNITMAIVLAVVSGLLSIFILVFGALWYAGFPRLTRDGVINVQTLFDLLKLAFALVAGIGGVVGLVVAYRRQRVAEHANQLAEFSHHLADAAERRAEYKKGIDDAAEERAKLEAARNGTRLLNDRFGRASDQLWLG